MRNLFLFTIIIIFIRCSETAVKSQTKEWVICDTLNFKILTKMLNSNLNELPFFNCYTQRDTILEGDDGISWNAKSFYFKGKIAFIVEADWEDPQTIKRITILSPIIKDGDMYVSQSFKWIKQLVNTEIPSSPDGYLFLNYRKNDYVFIQLDISGEPSNSPLFYGVNTLDKIPEELKVESIVIRKSQ